MTAEPRPTSYVAARVAAFVEASSRVLFCRDCWRGLPEGSSGGCAACGRAGAIIGPALSRSRPAAASRGRDGDGSSPSLTTGVARPCGQTVACQQDVVFRPDHHVAHVRHPIAGGAASGPWATIFEERLITRARGRGPLFEALRATTRDVLAEARALQARARCVRAVRPRAAA